MLDHDQLLPAEQANPGLLQELRTIYQMTPEEQRVLARVHERLSMYAYPLPVHDHEYEHEPVRVGYDSRPLQLVSPVSPRSKPVKTRQGWLRHLNAIAGVIFLVLLVGSLVFAFSATHRTSVGSTTTNGIRILLVPAATFVALSQKEMQEEGAMLSQRFSNFGLQGTSVDVQMIHGQLGLLVELPHFGGNEQQTINTLLENGIVAFWNTGPTTNTNEILAQGTTFDPSQYIQYNPGGQPPFTNQDLDPASLSVGRDPQTGALQINGEMKGDAIGRFGTFTQININYGLTITLDGKVLSSANIESAVTGPFVITGNFTQQQANAIVSILKETPLPFALKIVN